MDNVPKLLNEASRFKKEYKQENPNASNLEVFLELNPYEKVSLLDTHSRTFAMRELIKILGCHEDLCSVELKDLICNQLSKITLVEWEEKIRKPIEEAIKAKKTNQQ